MDEEIKMPENAPAEAILINDKIMTMGEFSVNVKKQIEDTGDVSVVFEGTLKIPYYEQNIEKLESRRYIVKNIDVIEEHYSSINEDIIYKFTCLYFRTKYQTELCDELENVINYKTKANKG